MDNNRESIPVSALTAQLHEHEKAIEHIKYVLKLFYSQTTEEKQTPIPLPIDEVDFNQMPPSPKKVSDTSAEIIYKIFFNNKNKHFTAKEIHAKYSLELARRKPGEVTKINTFYNILMRINNDSAWKVKREGDKGYIWRS